MRLKPIMAAFIAAGAFALLVIPAPSSAIVLNGVSCEDFTITASTTNGQLPSNGLVIDINDCGPDGISPFEGGGGSDCGNNQVEGAEQCDGSDFNGQTCLTQGASGGTLFCNDLCRFDTSNCIGAPTPTPTPTPPGPTPDNQSCPDGYLDEKVFSGQNTYGVSNVSIRPGTTKRYCMDVGNTNLVPSSQDINRIYVTWGDQTDYVCGVVEVSAQQATSPHHKVGPSTGTSGSVRFSKTAFRQPPCPECVQRGLYYVTVKGVQLYNPQDPKCERFTITWGVN